METEEKEENTKISFFNSLLYHLFLLIIKIKFQISRILLIFLIFLILVAISRRKNPQNRKFPSFQI